MNRLSQGAVNWVTVDPESAGQRIDNYLLRLLKGVPKSHVYRILRSGEVRVNRKRADPTVRLAAGDELRLPRNHFDFSLQRNAFGFGRPI